MLKDIKNYEGLYKINIYGSIWSCKRRKWLSINDMGGYLGITLCKNGICKSYKIHRLVAETFISNDNNLPQVNHKDGNKLNNNVENLEWCTSSQNLKHAIKTGLKQYTYVNKLTIDEVKTIKQLLKYEDTTHNNIAKVFNVSRSAISDINSGKTWKNI